VAEVTTKPTTSIAVGEYTTQKGDTYWGIAVRAYGDGFQWTKIYWANYKIFGNPDLIHADVKITIPALQK
jgi:nucleoid-associated protein YgaU